jgi:hypothetical protein
MEPWIIIVIGAVVVCLWVVFSRLMRRQRKKYLVQKYGSEEVAERIMSKEVWQGMSVEQLIDSWGKPEDIDQTVMKSKTKETWKYRRTGKNRYSQRVFLENNSVVGWQSH